VGSGKDSREAGERANRLGRGARLPNNLNGQTKSSIWLSRECASPTPAPSRVPARAMVPMAGTSASSVEAANSYRAGRWYTLGHGSARESARHTLGLAKSDSSFEVSGYSGAPPHHPVGIVRFFYAIIRL
jgi:hypothetical protein